jgi:moderate conductance mechanosensitive channel
MRDWLKNTIPGGVWHNWLVDGAEASVKIVLVILLFFVARWLAFRALKIVMLPLLGRAEREGPSSVARMHTLSGLARSWIGFIVFFLAAMTVLSQLGFNVAALVASAGVAGLAVSFGAQRLVRDVLTGFVLLLEDQFRVGEVVTLIGSPGLPQLNGTIREMGLRVTHLLDTSGKLVIIGNGDIAAVVNHSRGPVTATIELGVPTDVDLESVRKALPSVPLPDGLFTGPPEIEGVTAIEGAKMVLRIAGPASPGRAPEAELALRQAVGQALRQAGIEIK